MNCKNSKSKIVIVGAGNVGASIAYALTIKSIPNEIILIDKDVNRAYSEVLDIQHGINGMGTISIKVGTYSDCYDSNLIIITAGRNRRNGESRFDLINDNLSILREIIENIKPYYSDNPILLVSNPVDILTYECEQLMGIHNGKIFGTGTILDTSRLVRKIAEYIEVSSEMIVANVIGVHGDEQIPIWSNCQVAGIPIDDYCSSCSIIWDSQTKENIAKCVSTLGAEIIKGKGKTHFGIATCVCLIADAVVNNRHIIANVTSVLDNVNGVEGVALSVPSLITSNGVEKVLDIKMDELETDLFKKSSINIKQIILKLDN